MLDPNRDAPAPILIDSPTLDEAFARLIIQVVDNTCLLYTSDAADE